MRASGLIDDLAAQLDDLATQLGAEEAQRFSVVKTRLREYLIFATEGGI
jgi:hypothetical protein